MNYRLKVVAMVLHVIWLLPFKRAQISARDFATHGAFVRFQTPQSVVFVQGHRDARRPFL